jgi:hypothetical protein
VTNEVRIHGPKVALATFLDIATDGRARQPERYFRFEHLVPTPPTLLRYRNGQNMYGRVLRKAFRPRPNEPFAFEDARMGSNPFYDEVGDADTLPVPRTIAEWRDHLDDRVLRFEENMRAELGAREGEDLRTVLRVVAELYETNLACHKTTDASAWRRHHWGTTSECDQLSVDTLDGGLLLQFGSGDTPATGIYRHLLARFPGLEFRGFFQSHDHRGRWDRARGIETLKDTDLVGIADWPFPIEVCEEPDAGETVWDYAPKTRDRRRPRGLGAS